MAINYNVVSDEDALLTEGQAADFLGLAKGSLRNDRVTGSLNIPYVKLSPGKHGPVRYQKKVLIAVVEARTCFNTRQACEIGGDDTNSVEEGCEPRLLRKISRPKKSASKTTAPSLRNAK